MPSLLPPRRRAALAALAAVPSSPPSAGAPKPVSRQRLSAPLAGVALALAACLSGCSDRAETTPEPCTPGLAGDGTTTLAVGDLCLRGAALRVSSGGTWRDAGAGDTIDVTDAGNGDLLVTLSAAKGPVEAFELSFPAVDATAMLQQGYQSWSFAGTVKLPATVPLDEGGAPALKAASTGNPTDEVEGVSYGSAVLGGGAATPLVLGAVSAEHATTGIAATTSSDGARVAIVYGATREPLPAGDDGVVRSEPLFLAAAAGVNDGLDRLATAMLAAQPAATPEPKRPPGGWFSWNEKFADVDAELVLAHVAIAESTLAPAGLPLVEIDDGWEGLWGDWQANDKFPGGMEAMGAAITAKGLVAGVWMAPFLVELESKAAVGIDPAFLVKGADGKPLVHRPSGSVRDFHVLDGSNPAAMKLATDAIASLHAAGFRFFKLDFLYAGALPGGRSDPAATGTDALRAGLALLRETAGPDSILNACGAPIVPVLGLTDSLRIGSDTAFDGAALNWPTVAFAGRSHAARAFLAPLAWPDADQAQLRPPYTEEEALAGAAVAALAGPAYSLGDDLTTLDPARLALGLSPDLLDIAGAAAPAVPLDFFEAPAEQLVVSPIIDAIQAGAAGTLAPPPSTFAVTGKSGARYQIAFSWAASHGVTITKQP